MLRSCAPVVFHYLDRFAEGQACALDCEGIVSKRLGSPYRAGRTDHMIKIKNSAAPAVKRETEGEWRKIGAREA